MIFSEPNKHALRLWPVPEEHGSETCGAPTSQGARHPLTKEYALNNHDCIRDPAALYPLIEEYTLNHNGTRDPVALYPLIKESALTHNGIRDPVALYPQIKEYALNQNFY